MLVGVTTELWCPLAAASFAGSTVAAASAVRALPRDPTAANAKLTSSWKQIQSAVRRAVNFPPPDAKFDYFSKDAECARVAQRLVVCVFCLGSAAWSTTCYFVHTHTHATQSRVSRGHVCL